MQFRRCKAFERHFCKKKTAVISGFLAAILPKVKKTSACAEVMDGEPARTRTGDQKIKSLLLYQLSYEPHQKPVPNITESTCQQNFDRISIYFCCQILVAHNFIIGKFPCIIFNKKPQGRTAKNELEGHPRQTARKGSQKALRGPHSALCHHGSIGYSRRWNNLRKGCTLVGGNGWIFARDEFGESRHSTSQKGGKTARRAATTSARVELSRQEKARARFETSRSSSANFETSNLRKSFHAQKKSPRAFTLGDSK